MSPLSIVRRQCTFGARPRAGAATTPTLGGPRRRRWTWASRLALCVAAMVMALVGAAGEARAATTLVVQVRSDLVPGTQLAHVEVVTEAPDECGNARHVRYTPGAGKNWGVGVRVAEHRLEGERASLTVAAIAPNGTTIVRRPVRADLRGGVQVVTVWLTGDGPCPGNACADAGDPVVPGVTLVFDTGNDDLRGGNDNLDVVIGFRDGGTQTFRNVNGGRRWRDRCSARVFLALAGQRRRSEIAWVRLTTTSGGDAGGDNWDLHGLHVQDEQAHFLFMQRLGAPWKRFSGDHPSVTTHR